MHDGFQWHQSGRDGLSHAFRAAGGFVDSVHYDLPSVGEVELKVSICGQQLPVAFVMPHEGPGQCPTCVHLYVRESHRRSLSH